mgnify:CR=1 FL=1
MARLGLAEKLEAPFALACPQAGGNPMQSDAFALRGEPLAAALQDELRLESLLRLLRQA